MLAPARAAAPAAPPRAVLGTAPGSSGSRRRASSRRHRSTSPITESSEPTIAIRSATAASCMHVAVASSATKLGRAELHAPRLRPAVRDDVAAELAAGRLDRHVDLALGHEVPLGDDLEVVDQRLHRRVELVPRRQHDLAVVRDPWLALQLLEPVEALPDDPHRLAHLVQVHAVAVEDVAAVVDGHLEVDLVVGEVRLVAAEVPVDAGGAQRRARTGRARSRRRSRAARRPSSARARSCSGSRIVS